MDADTNTGPENTDTAATSTAPAITDVPTVAVGPFEVVALPQSELIDHIVQWPVADGPGVMCHLHVGALNHRDDAEFVEAMAAADVVYADGSATVLIGKAAGANALERAGLTDIGHDILERLATRLERPVRTGLLGGPEGLAERAGAALAAAHPTEIVFTEHGYHDETMWPALLAECRATNPDVLFVGLGMPREAIWAQAYRDQLPNALILAAGGFFGHVAGDEKRAPEWAQKAGMEWMWRVAQDPQGKAKRYAQGAVTTAVMAAKTKAKR
jgi:N-acetylglucosaminyldiphosphoundecaprenol N-acetyl-beta-D-mannosaminyltransferase